MIRPGPRVFFYLPSPQAVENAPDSIEKYAAWVDAYIQLAPIKLPNGKLCTWLGPYNWVVQTFLYLKAYGFPCVLTASLPDEGIIITHSDLLSTFLRPSAEQFIVEIKPDRSLRCIFSNFVIVQNKRDSVHFGMRRLLINSAFVDYWPQAGLMPRDPTRGDRFENICYMGNEEQFLDNAEELGLELRKLGLKWRMVPRNEWHDYREFDALIAVRQVDSYKVGATHLPSRKPASKLRNAWAAGVPAILSPDIAFQDIRKSELDFLEAKTIPEVLDSIKRLMNDPTLRCAMRENGLLRAREFKLENIISSWIEIITTQIIPRYLLWRRSSYRRNWLYLIRKLAFNISPSLLDRDIDK
jgi:hypothetical protein